jgi:hypothetical protein
MNPIDRPAIAAGSITAEPEAGPLLRGSGLRSARWLLGFAGLLLSGQIVLFFALFDRSIELGTYVGAHLLCCLVLLSYLASRRGTLGDQYLGAVQIVGWSALAGPFGTFVTIALTLPRGGADAESQSVPDAATDRLTDDRSPIERMHTALLDRRVRIQDACRVRPLIDVVVEGSRSDKLEAVSVVYRNYEAGLAVLLKRALRDHDTSVRVMAATVIAKLHAKYGGKIGGCQLAAASNPNVAQNWRQLAESRLAYAESSLLEGARARGQIESAIDELSRAVEQDPSDTASVSCLIRARRLMAHGGRD